MTSFANDIAQLNKLREGLSNAIEQKAIMETSSFTDKAKQLCRDKFENIKREIEIIEENVKTHPEYKVLGEAGIQAISPQCAVEGFFVEKKGSSPHREIRINCNMTSVKTMLISINMPFELRPIPPARNYITADSVADQKRTILRCKNANAKIFNSIVDLDETKSKIIIDLANKLVASERKEYLADYEIIKRNGLAKEFLAKERQEANRLLGDLGVKTYYEDSCMEFREFVEFVVEKHATLAPQLLDLAITSEEKITLHELVPTLFKINLFI